MSIPRTWTWDTDERWAEAAAPSRVVSYVEKRLAYREEKGHRGPWAAINYPWLLGRGLRETSSRNRGNVTRTVSPPTDNVVGLQG